jgi:hypothetical protein
VNSANCAEFSLEKREKLVGAVCALTRNVVTARPEIDALTERTIGCGIEVHRTLGPGLLESIYRECLIIEMTEQGLRVDTELPLQLDYKGRILLNSLSPVGNLLTS